MKSSAIIIKGELQTEVCGSIPSKGDPKIVYNDNLSFLPFNPFYVSESEVKIHLKRSFGKGWYQIVVYDGALGPRRPFGTKGIKVV